MDGLHEQAEVGEDAFAGSRGRHDETLEAGIIVFAAIEASHVARHASSQRGECSHQHDVALNLTFRNFDDTLQEFRPVCFRQSGERVLRIATG